MSIEDAIAARGTGNVWATTQCYRCWVEHRRKNHTNITLVEGTAYCLECVDERNQEDAEHLARLTAIYAEAFDDDGMTVGDVFHWIKKHVFRSG